MAASKFALVVFSAAIISGGASEFVPACMVKECGHELAALGTDGYTSEVASCAVENFGPCASKAWDCLGDETCRKAATCAPQVFNTCKADIWKMLTDQKEREIIMCIEKCPIGKDGHPSPVCVAAKCGEAAVQCLLDTTCRDVVNCVPKALMACSKSAFQCIFNSDGVCRENVQCLGSGLAQCSSSGVNLLTDTKIADLITCTGSKCPHPAALSANAATSLSAHVGVGVSASLAPLDAVKQLVCMEAKCPLKLPKILLDKDSKDLLTCVGKTDFSPVWDCLGDKECQNSLSCWAKPLDTCAQDIWTVLTDDVERRRVEASVACLRTCEHDHHDDFTDAALCALDKCSQGLLDCYHDDKCKSAVKCLPSTATQCSIPTLDNYLHQQKFQKATKALANGLELCGRAAVEMLRDQNIAEAVRCAAQCTHAPKDGLTEAAVIV